MSETSGATTRVEMQPWTDALNLLAENGLPAPPPLSVWPTEVQRYSESIFGTWKPSHSLYELEDVLREAFENAPDGAMVAGFDGHGVQSWAFHVVVRTGPIVVGIQVEAGGFYTNPETSATALEGAWELLVDIVETTNKIASTERILVICDADFAGHRWGWATRGDWNSIDWRDEKPALFCAHMNLLREVPNAGSANIVNREIGR